MTRRPLERAAERGDLVTRDVCGLAEMKACEALYCEVMGLRPEDGSINPRLLIALQHNGGHVIGAFTQDRLLGFAYSFLGRDSSAVTPELYQYSQLTVVAHDAQGQGVGRLLKFAQRERTRASGIWLMRWAYHPLRASNAHFNLDVLGGQVARLVPSMYGSKGFGAGAEEGTDRFIVDWDLAAPDQPTTRPSPPEIPWEYAHPVTEQGDVLIAMPASWEACRASLGVAETRRLRTDLVDAFASVLDSGRVVVSCQFVNDAVAVYRFAPQNRGGV